MKRLLEIIKDKEVWVKSFTIPGIIFGAAATFLTFIELDNPLKIKIFISLLLICIIWIFAYFFYAVRLQELSFEIDGSKINIKSGNIFDYPNKYLKVIAFNEFFDTTVDEKIIISNSLNGQYINKFYKVPEILDEKISKDIRLNSKIIEEDVMRPLGGKTTRYHLGSGYRDNDYFLFAFSKFNDDNKAELKLSEYANCLIDFWNEINSLYAQQEVIVPLLGSGITRKRDFHATDQQLLEVMLWTFQISKVKFKEPSEVTILLYGDRIKKINLYKLKEFGKNDI